MRIKSAMLGLVMSVSACGVTGIPEQMEPEAAIDDVGWEVFSVDEMRTRRVEQGTSFLEVMADSVFRMGLLHRQAGASLGLVTHRENVVYHVVSGAALLSTESTDVQLERGSLTFVRGGVEHRFRSITSDLDVIAVFSRRVPIPEDPEVAAFTLTEMVAARDSEQNVWTGLLETSSMNMGMYMLPKGGRDDGILAHDFDEFKIVVNGGGRFDLGADGVAVGPGSIVLIGADVPHRFRRVSDALDVLVIWAR